MKKCCVLVLLLAICLLLIPNHVAHADVLIEPNNDFYARHRNECASLNRSFYANGESGFISVKKEPGSNKEVTAVKNGETLYIMFTYNDNGRLWGVTDFHSPGQSYDKRLSGWIPMDQLALVYDYISFDEDYGNEFYSYTGSYDALHGAVEIVLWTWPGSGVAVWTIEASNIPEDIDAYLTESKTYKDEQGREWGFIGYMYGHRNSWICLSDPSNKDIPAFHPAPLPELWPSKETDAPYDPATSPDPGRYTDPDTSNDLPTTLIILALVFVLVVGTAILIKVFWKPNSNKEKR